MGQRFANSSSRSTGGVSPTTGYAQDTVVVLGGDGRKKILTLTWSYGANGGGVPTASLPLYGRLIVIANVDASGYLAAGNLPTGPTADFGAGGIGAFGGRLVFDCDIQAALGSICGQFVFPDEGNDGWVGTDSGPLTLILTAPMTATGGQIAGVIGKLNVQYDNSYAKAPADGPPGYVYTGVSKAPSN